MAMTDDILATNGKRYDSPLIFLGNETRRKDGWQQETLLVVVGDNISRPLD